MSSFDADLSAVKNATGEGTVILYSPGLSLIQSGQQFVCWIVGVSSASCSVQKSDTKKREVDEVVITKKLWEGRGTQAEGFFRIGCWGRYLGLRRSNWQGTWETAQWGASRFVLLVIKHCSGDEIKNNAFGIYGEADICIQGLLVGDPEGKRPVERPKNEWEVKGKDYPRTGHEGSEAE